MVTLIQVVPDLIDVGQANDENTYVMLGFDENTPEAEVEMHVRIFLTTEQARALYEKLYPYTFTPEQAAEL